MKYKKEFLTHDTAKAQTHAVPKHEKKNKCIIARRDLFVEAKNSFSWLIAPKFFKTCTEKNTKEFPCRGLKKKIPFQNKIHTGRTLQCLVWNVSRTPLLSVLIYDNSQTQHRAFPLGVSTASFRKNTSLWSAWTRCMGFASWRRSLVNWRQTRNLPPPCGSPASRCAEAPALSRICWWRHTATAWTRTRSWCSSTSSNLIS